MWDDTPRPGHQLMARDAARLASAEADPASAPDLLWFTWDRPTISLGRLQDPSDARAAEAAGVPVVVRPTGGRAVFHVDEWTYGAVVPLAHAALGGTLSAACRAITRTIAAALEEAYGLPARLADEAGDRRPVRAEGPENACFAREYGYEIVVAGRKLAGSAQRRGTRALLQQGSLLVGPGHERIAGLLGGGDVDGSGARGLARHAVTLTELLGSRPDPRPFRAAMERRWGAMAEPPSSQAPSEAPAAHLTA